MTIQMPLRESAQAVFRVTEIAPARMVVAAPRASQANPTRASGDRAWNARGDDSLGTGHGIRLAFADTASSASVRRMAHGKRSTGASLPERWRVRGSDLGRSQRFTCLRSVAAFVCAAVLAGCGSDGNGGPPLTSEEVLAPGRYAVGYQRLELVDASRSTKVHGSYPGAPSRTLHTNVWYPLDPATATAASDSSAAPRAAAGRHPLIVYGHGFMSWGTEGTFLCEHLASSGYVVVAPDFPATNILAPGGPDLNDVVNQPGDESFLIDTWLRFDTDPTSPFHGAVDGTRVGVAGVSLGGMTSTLTTYHPYLRDPRIAAAVSIAGPGSMFTAAFYANAAAPLLMLAGDIDAIVDYATNARVVEETAGNKLTLVTLRGATHTGFTQPASEFMEGMSNPDRLGCAALTLELSTEVDFAALLGGEAAGIVQRETPFPCSVTPLPPAIRPSRQHQLEILAVQSFFDGHFAASALERARAKRFLHETLPAENSEATVE